MFWSLSTMRNPRRCVRCGLVVSGRFVVLRHHHSHRAGVRHAQAQAVRMGCDVIGRDSTEIHRGVNGVIKSDAGSVPSDLVSPL
jgi:hypothetical protein